MQTECRQQSKTKRPKFIRKVTCQVCGDIANDHTHYGGVACYSCKGKQQQKKFLLKILVLWRIFSNFWIFFSHQNSFLSTQSSVS